MIAWNNLKSCVSEADRIRTNVVCFAATASEKDLLPLTPNVVRGLNDKLYEKWQKAALEIER